MFHHHGRLDIFFFFYKNRFIPINNFVFNNKLFMTKIYLQWVWKSISLKEIIKPSLHSYSPLVEPSINVPNIY